MVNKYHFLTLEQFSAFVMCSFVFEIIDAGRPSKGGKIQIFNFADNILVHLFGDLINMKTHFEILLPLKQVKYQIQKKRRNIPVLFVQRNLPKSLK